MTIEQLQERVELLERENALLTQQLHESEQEKQLIARNVKRAIDVVGLRYDSENKIQKSAIIKQVTALITQATINPGALEKKFEFLKELAPIVEKYK